MQVAEHKSAELSVDPLDNGCAHEWTAGQVLNKPAMFCDKCRSYTQISKAEFKSRFKQAFWRVQKQMDDDSLHGGYMANKKRRMRWFR